MVLRPGFEPGSPARKAGILGSRMVFNLAIFGREDYFLPSSTGAFPEHHASNLSYRFKFSRRASEKLDEFGAHMSVLWAILFFAVILTFKRKMRSYSLVFLVALGGNSGIYSFGTSGPKRV